MELPAPAARDPAGRVAARDARATPTCSPRSSCRSGRSCGASRHDGPRPPVLLIDEIDRADDEFEALLLEFLGEGVGHASRSSARSPRDAAADRGAHLQPQPRPARRAAPPLPLPLDRLPRRRSGRRRSCGARCPAGDEPLIDVGHRSSSGTCAALDLDKAPGMAEAIDWVAALSALGVTELVARRRRRDAGRPGEDPRRPRARSPARRRLLRGSADRGGPALCCAASTGPRFVVALGERLRRAGVPVDLHRARRPSPTRWALAPPADRGRALLDCRVTLVEPRRTTWPLRRGVRRGVPRRACCRPQGHGRAGRPRGADDLLGAGRERAGRCRRTGGRAALAHAAARPVDAPTSGDAEAAACRELLPSAVAARRRHRRSRSSTPAAAGRCSGAGWRRPGAAGRPAAAAAGRSHPPGPAVALRADHRRAPGVPAGSRSSCAAPARVRPAAAGVLLCRRQRSRCSPTRRRTST